MIIDGTKEAIATGGGWQNKKASHPLAKSLASNSCYYEFQAHED